MGAASYLSALSRLFGAVALMTLGLWLYNGLTGAEIELVTRYELSALQVQGLTGLFTLSRVMAFCFGMIGSVLTGGALYSIGQDYKH
jgi:hypothetical protein